MAFEQYLTKESKSVSAAESVDSETPNGCFDCNICLDFAREPVVTLCGHLYCWPCIYKWFHVQSASIAPDEHPQCPVCKAKISHTAVVPLYGRGQTLTEPELKGKAIIPPRPAACGPQALTTTSGTTQQLPYRNPYQNQHYDPHQYEHEASSPLFNLGSNTMTAGSFHPMVGMFGEMVYARVFGNSGGLYAYPNSYHLMGGSSPRLRRQEMQVDKSLNRISIFLFCCFLLCLFLF